MFTHQRNGATVVPERAFSNNSLMRAFTHEQALSGMRPWPHNNDVLTSLFCAVALMAQSTFRNATPADLDDLIALEERCFRDDRISRRSFRRFIDMPQDR